MEWHENSFSNLFFSCGIILKVNIPKYASYTIARSLETIAIEFKNVSSNFKSSFEYESEDRFFVFKVQLKYEKSKKSVTLSWIKCIWSSAIPSIYAEEIGTIYLWNTSTNERYNPMAYNNTFMHIFMRSASNGSDVSFEIVKSCQSRSSVYIQYIHVSTDCYNSVNVFHCISMHIQLLLTLPTSEVSGWCRVSHRL